MRTIVVTVILTMFIPVGLAESQPVRRVVCSDGDAVREIELHAVEGVADVCEIVERTRGEAIEERLLHPAPPRSALCASRFENVVQSASDDGWQCSVEKTASRRLEVGSFARDWRARCVSAHADTRHDAERLCDCTIELMSKAGFEERDFEVLASPYADDGLRTPVHRAGLLYGVGMMAVDALARCSRP